jgi:hypothetical protein
MSVFLTPFLSGILHSIQFEHSDTGMGFALMLSECTIKENIMKKILLISLFLAGSIFAIPVGVNWAVDFRTAAWSSADGQATHTVSGITASALPGGKVLYQDSNDGLGIKGGENDEVDRAEQLEVSFGSGLMVTGVWITDLFLSADGGLDGENGEVELNIVAAADQTFSFTGVFPQGTGNGELYVPFGTSLNVQTATFNALPFNQGSTGDEFSVAGFTAVPEPGTLILFALGIFGFIFRRKLLK